MYRNVVYNNKSGKITLFTWDENGKRVTSDVTFEPYIYLEDPRGNKTTLFNTKAKKRSFQSNYFRSKFIKESGIKRVFENISCNQQFLIDSFWDKNETPEFSKHPLKTMFIDIETYSPHSEGFPDVNNPTHPIIAITCYDSLSKTYTTFGVNEYVANDEAVEYIKCKTEKDLIIKFTNFFKQDYPDILSGWNCSGFDIPYIVGRISLLMGQEFTAQLSPIRNIYSRDVIGRFGSSFKRHYIDGISCIDYLEIYRKFCLTLRQSYKLDYIAQVELGENKIDYGSISLADLSDSDWQKFIDYNIHDVRLLVRLEEKLQYIKLLRMLAYVGLTTFEGSLGSIALLTGAMTIKARQRGVIMPTFVRSPSSGKNPGAYVSEPLQGFRNNVVTFDAASLYPSVMMSLNMSPETKIGRITKLDENNIRVDHVTGKSFNMTKEKLSAFLQAEKCAISKAGIIFSQKTRGIVPEFLDYYFNKRVEVKKKLKKLQQKLASKPYSENTATIKDEIDRLDTEQLVIKILINSLYGAFGNKQASFGDDDIASSVTLTGQSIIKKSNDIIREFIKREIPDLTKQEYDESIVYNDTDSYTFDTRITTEDGVYDAQSLWEKYSNIVGSNSMWGHEIITVKDLSVWSYDKHQRKDSFRKVKNLIRHKVTKEKFKIKVGDKSVIMTGDHGCLIKRNDELVRVSAKDIQKGDIMLVS
jgi:DNA polymerase elongation subunit (family B)